MFAMLLSNKLLTLFLVLTLGLLLGRITVARLSVRFPQVLAMLADGRLHLSGLRLLDRHLTDGRRNKAAIIWQGEPEEDVKVYTYQILN